MVATNLQAHYPITPALEAEPSSCQFTNLYVEKTGLVDIS
jgi:hypothetical protein